MSEGPGEPSFVDVANGIVNGTPRKRGERRGLFGRRRRSAPEDDGFGAPPEGWDDTAAIESPTRRNVRVVPSAQDTSTLRWGVDTAVVPGQGRWSDEDQRPAPEHPATRDQPPARDRVVDAARDADPAPVGPDQWIAADAEESSSFVRPYARTGGRTRPAFQLAVETLVSLGSQGRDPSRIAQYEHRAIAELCGEPRSVAEVAALLNFPLGVARVLLGDMASQGIVVVHQTAGTAEAGPDLALMERVLSGLRRL